MLQPAWSRGSIRGVVSDLDGVVYRGEAPIASSVEAFRRWRKQGVPYAFVTNNSSLSASQFAKKLSRMGVSVTRAQIFTTIEASAALLRQRWPRGGSAYVIGERPLIEAVKDADFTLVGADADVVVLGFDCSLTYDKLRVATRAVLGGAPVIATNPDALTPAPDGYDPCVGMTIAAISAAVPEAEIVVVGKPQPFMIEQAVALLGVAKTEAIMIGDQLATDIVAGQRAGLRSILLASDAPFNGVSTTTPDGIVASLLDLVDVPVGAGQS
jgi:HAD superfamily hydrolase (TIGR01450 family)